MRRTHTPAVALLAAALAIASALLVPSPALADPGGRSAEHANGWYLALGDSLAAGYQPTTGDNKTGGYVGGVLDALLGDSPKTTLVNDACSGETVVTFVQGGRCAYDEGSQLAAALHFLRARAPQTRLITLDIGANDVQPCVNRVTLALDLACFQQGLTHIATLLPQALAQLHAAAPRARIVVLNYYDPFLAGWLAGPTGQALAVQSLQLLATLNGIIANAAAGAGAEVADIATAFHTTDTSVGSSGLPVNVATICAWTWMCSRFDIHANDTGYAVMAQTVAGKL